MTDLSKYRQPFPTGSPTSLTVVAWPDPTVDTRGHKPGSPYVEAVWLGVLGPSTTLCWARLSRIANARPSTVIDTTDLALSLGLSGQLGRNAPITRTLSRMVMFGAAAAPAMHSPFAGRSPTCHHGWPAGYPTPPAWPTSDGPHPQHLPQKRSYPQRSPRHWK